MDKLPKHGGPNSLEEAWRGLRKRKATAKQRNQQIRGLKGEVTKLRKELFDERMERANYWVHAGRMIMWIENPNRPPAITAFTEGPERQIAYAIERRHGL